MSQKEMRKYESGDGSWQVEAARFRHERLWQLSTKSADEELLRGNVSRLASTGDGYVSLYSSMLDQLQLSIDKTAERIRPAVTMHLYVGALMANKAARVEIHGEGSSQNADILETVIKETELPITEGCLDFYIPAVQIIQICKPLLPPRFVAFGQRLAQSSSSR